jgi:nucleotide-binding universal stress UspA family protein
VAVGLAEKHRGSLMVMHAIPEYVPIHGPVVRPSAAEVEREGRQLAEVVAAAVKGRRPARVRTWIMVGPPAGCVLLAAQKADAIVMGTLGRTGLRHVLLGSVAERVVRHATIPVLTVRAESAKAARATRTRRARGRR